MTEGIEVTKDEADHCNWRLVDPNKEGDAKQVRAALRGSQVTAVYRHEDGTYTVQFYNHDTKAVHHLHVTAGKLTENV